MYNTHVPVVLFPTKKEKNRRNFWLSKINNYWTRLSKISWFVSGEHINYLPQPLKQIIDLWDTDKSQYFAITEFNNCFIIRSPFFWSTKYVKRVCLLGELIGHFHTRAHLFVGSYLQVTWWALSQWKGRKNTSSYNDFYYDQMKRL